MSRYRSVPLVGLALLLSCAALSAQNYIVSSITNDFNTHNISTTGTVLAAGAAQDDNQELVNFPTTPTPFTFTYYGVTYTSIYVNSNGWISLGSTPATTSAVTMRTPPTAVPLAAEPNNWIGGSYCDLNPADATSGKVKVERLSSPDRFVILYDQVSVFNTTGAQKAHFAIVLYAATSVIEVHYSTAQNISAPPTGIAIAIEDQTGALATARPGALNTFPTPTDAFRWAPPTGNVLTNQTSSSPTMLQNGVNAVHLNFVGLISNAPNASINAITFNKSGTVPDGSVSLVKLVRDNNNDSMVDAGDTTLMQGVFAGGVLTFSGSPLQALTTGVPVRLLLALDYSGLTLGDTLAVSINSSASVVWSSGTDLTSYPLSSPTRTVSPPVLNLGNPTTGTTNTIPFNSSSYQRMMTVYAAGEIAPLLSGNVITEIQIHGTNVAVSPTFVDFQIRLGRSDKVPSSATAPTGIVSHWEDNVTGPQTLVFQRDLYAPEKITGIGANMIYRFPLDRPYVYAGGGINVDLMWRGRIGTGFNIIGDTARNRIYTTAGTNTGPVPSIGTVSTTAGNFGINMLYDPAPGNHQFLTVAAPFVSLFDGVPLTDKVVMDLRATAVGAARDLSSLTFAKLGAVSDASIAGTKLVVDINSNGVVDGADPVLGTTTGLTAGAATFTFAPALTVSTATPSRLLFAITTAAPLTAGQTLGFQLAGTTSATWNGGKDLSGYPLTSVTFAVTAPQATAGLPGNPLSTTTVPFGSTQTRFQLAYDASELANIPAGALISEIRVHGTAATVGSWNNLVLRVGHTDVSSKLLSMTFAANFDGDPSVVLQSASFVPTTTPSLAGGNLYGFVFTTPFVYNGKQGLTVDFEFASRTGTGFSVWSQQSRNAVYTTLVPPQTVAATSTLFGNFGMDFLWVPAPSGVALTRATATGIKQSMTDHVVMDFQAHLHGGTSSLSSITLNKVSGSTVADASITSIKLIRDVNDNGLFDGGDTQLGTGTLTGGATTLSVVPAVSVSPGTPVRLLVTATTASPLALADTFGLEITGGGSMNWSGGPTHLTAFPFGTGLQPVRMAGTYTINQTSGNFNDIGTAFDAIETMGVCGPVILEITDSATYTSTPSYSLGNDSNVATVSVPIVIRGVSARNHITLRAAPGQTPAVEGNATGAVLVGSAATTVQSGRGGLAINHSYVTVEGIRVFGGPHFGIMAQGNFISPFWLNNTDITIRRCIVHDIPNGPGIAHMGLNGGYANNFLVENNFVWSCLTASLATSPQLQTLTNGCITVRNPGVYSSTVRHNTVLHTSAVASTGGLYLYSSSTAYPLHDLNNNIIVSTNATIPAAFINNIVNSPSIANTNFNCLFASATSNQAILANFGLWQGTGRDPNGTSNDPLLLSTTAPIDLHLAAGSPAVNPVGQTSTVLVDIDGQPRLAGLQDIGADEAGPIMVVQQGTTSIPDGGSHDVGVFSTTGSTVTFTIRNNGALPLTLTGTPRVAITLISNMDATTIVQSQPSLSTIAPTGTTTFVVNIDPTAGGPFSLTLSIANNDEGRNPYNFTVTGLVGPDIDVLYGATPVPNAPTPPVNLGTTVYPLNTAASVSFTISNANGGQPLNISSITATAVSNCSAVSAGAPVTSTVGVGNNTTFNVNFTPTNGPNFSFSVTINTNDPQDPVYGFTAQGLSNTAPVITAFYNSTAPTNGTAITSGGNIPTVLYNSSLAALGLRFRVNDGEAQNTSLQVTIAPTVTTEGFLIPAEWASTSAVVPYNRTPATGSFNIPSASYLVTLVANDGFANSLPFTFTIPVGVNTVPSIDLPTGSAFTGNAATGFSTTIGPATLPATFTLRLVDIDNNTISITAVAPPAPAPGGITAPGVTSNNPTGTVVSFTGNAALAFPGIYTWTFTISDGVGTPVNVDATITVLNVAASHTAGVNAGSGDGSAANPYAAAAGLGITPSLTMAVVTDANTPQTLTQVSVTADAANPSGKFSAAYAGTGSVGQITLAAASKLTVSDVGEHTFTVRITDGTTPIDVVVRISVDTTLNSQPVAGRPTGSTFQGTQAAGFTLALGPNEVLTANATLSLTDNDGDPVQVLSVTGGGQVLGVTPPTPAGVATSLTWVGAMNANNVPGDYDYSITITDNVTMPVTFTVTITVLNVNPAHVAGADATGSGSVAVPYDGVHEVGRAGPLAMAVLSDLNTSQTLTLVSAPPAATNPTGGSGFTIALTSNTLYAIPTKVLVNRDVGVHRFTATVSDGITTSVIELSIKVTAPASTTDPASSCSAAGTSGAGWAILILAALGVVATRRRRVRA